MIEHNCPHCGKQLVIEDRYAGQSGKCVHCQGVMQVPKCSTAGQSKVADSGSTPTTAAYESRNLTPGTMRRFLPRMNVSAIILTLCLCVLAYQVGVEATKAGLRNTLREGFRQLRAPVPAVFSDGATKKADTVVVETKLGVVASLATIDIQVNSAVEQTVITSKNSFSQPKIANSGSKYVIVNATITARTQAPFTFHTSGAFRLVDSSGREFTTDSPFSGTSFFVVDDCLEMRSLQPGVPETGNLLYLVSTDASRYSLMVPKGGTNEAYRFELR